MYLCFACVSVHHMSNVPTDARGDIRYPTTGVTCGLSPRVGPGNQTFKCFSAEYALCNPPNNMMW